MSQFYAQLTGKYTLQRQAYSLDWAQQVKPATYLNAGHSNAMYYYETKNS